jgi:hypothetical protein
MLDVRDWKGYRRRLSWPMLRYKPKENHIKVSQDNRSPSRDSKENLPEYEARMATAQLLRSTFTMLIISSSRMLTNQPCKLLSWEQYYA